jgi:hypothetical protein
MNQLQITAVVHVALLNSIDEAIQTYSVLFIKDIQVREPMKLVFCFRMDQLFSSKQTHSGSFIYGW